MLQPSSAALLRDTATRNRLRCFQLRQVRHLKLLHELFVQPPFPISAKNQAHLDASQYKELPSPDDITLNLRSIPLDQPERLILSNAQERLEPLRHLNLSTHQLSPEGSLFHHPENKRLYHSQNKVYEILPLTLPNDFVPTNIRDKWPEQGKRTPSGKPKMRHSFPHAGRGHQTHLTIYTPRAHLIWHLTMAYRCLLQGCRIEFHLHQKSKDERVENTVDWAIENSLHLRPDTILRAMPEGTEMLGLPATSKSHMGEELVWVFELPRTLAKAGHTTPGYIKKRAMWGHKEASGSE